MYTVFYGLREKPFALSPDPRYLFLAESHREALAHLLYGIDQGEGFIAITGEVGTGKTTLCRTLLRRVGAGTEIAFLFNPYLSPEDLLAAINAEFGIEKPGESPREQGNRLHGFLLEKPREGRRVLLIIDEAQNLPNDTLEQLRLVSNLETETSKLIQIVLLGQPELETKLASAALRQLRQRIGVHWRLEPLGETETREYVRHRLRIAAGAEREIFSERALRELHRRSGGIPRVLNILCDRALLAGYAAGAGQIGVSLVARAHREQRTQGISTPRRWARRPSFRRWVAAPLLLLILAAAGGFAFARLFEAPLPAGLPQIGSPPPGLFSPSRAPPEVGPLSPPAAEAAEDAEAARREGLDVESEARVG